MSPFLAEVNVINLAGDSHSTATPNGYSDAVAEFRASLAQANAKPQAKAEIAAATAKARRDTAQIKEDVAQAKEDEAKDDADNDEDAGGDKSVTITNGGKSIVVHHSKPKSSSDEDMVFAADPHRRHRLHVPLSHRPRPDGPVHNRNKRGTPAQMYMEGPARRKPPSSKNSSARSLRWKAAWNPSKPSSSTPPAPRKNMARNFEPYRRIRQRVERWEQDDRFGPLRELRQRLYRSPNGKVLGVFRGIAESMGFNVCVTRIVGCFILLTLTDFFGAHGLMVTVLVAGFFYLLAALLMQAPRPMGAVPMPVGGVNPPTRRPALALRGCIFRSHRRTPARGPRATRSATRPAQSPHPAHGGNRHRPAVRLGTPHGRLMPPHRHIVGQPARLPRDGATTPSIGMTVAPGSRSAATRQPGRLPYNLFNNVLNRWRGVSWVALFVLAWTLAGCADTSHQLVISVPEQRMVVIKDGIPLAIYPVSTSKFGLGDRPGSSETPFGALEIADKIGGGCPAGTAFKNREPTGEIVTADAPGRDTIVSRILWLRGLDPDNQNAYDRYIYIHGTAAERSVGLPVSYGCIRMRSLDIIALYDEIGVGAKVFIRVAPLASAARDFLVPEAIIPERPVMAEAPPTARSVTAR